MEVWNRNGYKFTEIPQKQVKFLDEIEQVCKKYNLSISHEDYHGSFEITEYDQELMKWLREATVAWK